MKNKIQFAIRKLNASDINSCISLFQSTVHSVNANDYSQQELNAWAPLVAPKDIDNYAYWQTLTSNISYVAEYDNQIVGFADISDKGYLDRLFVHKDFQKQGIASALVRKLENEALKLGIKRIITESSITAKLFFLKEGFYVVKEQVVEIRSRKLKNYLMAKEINRLS